MCQQTSFAHGSLKHAVTGLSTSGVYWQRPMIQYVNIYSVLIFIKHDFVLIK